MPSNKLTRICQHITNKTFISIFFGCRVNAAESNQLSQLIIDQGFTPLNHLSNHLNGLVLINTCSITQKGENESLRKIKSLIRQFPKSTFVITGCVSQQKIPPSKKIIFLSNQAKRHILEKLNPIYTHQIIDKLSLSDKYLLNVQTGCNHFCTYCIVPYKRHQLWSLPIDQAIDQINRTHKLGFKQLIITGTNLDLYTPGLSNLIEVILKQTTIPKISFGSIALNCIDKKFIELLKTHPDRFINFLHVPLQSCSNSVLKNMNRPYTQKHIISTFSKLKKIKSLKFGTDIIVGFPGETDKDFQQTYELCQSIGFSKIHTFRYSPRPDTTSIKLKLTKVNNLTKKHRSQKILSLTSQTTPPYHQTPEN